MIKAILIDDEKDALITLSKKIQMYCDGIEVIAQCNSAKEGLTAINNLNPDLVLLDIEMPWMNGFELLGCLGDKLDFSIVFVTAYDQYAIQAFKVKAMDYLLKPVDKDDLIACVEGIKQQFKKIKQQDVKDLMAEMHKPLNLKRIMIHSSDGIEVLMLEEILYCQAASNYTYIFTTDGRKILASKTLSDIDKSLQQNNFVRVHKSYTANLKFVQRYSSSDGGSLVFRDGQAIPVSRRKKDEVLTAISSFQ